MTPTKRPSSFWLIFILLIVIGIIVLLYIDSRFLNNLYGQEKVSFVYCILLLIFLAISAILNRHLMKLSFIFYSVLGWAIIGFILFSVYSLRFELRQFGTKLLSELNPSIADINSNGKVSIRSNINGQFILEARVVYSGRGLPIRFLVDTGATNVVLSPRDARNLSVNFENLQFNQRYQTANGVVLGAPIRLDKIGVGSISINNIRASVNKSEIGLSLLGMSYLDRLGGFEVRNNILTLNP